LAYEVDTYKKLIKEIGEGALADRLLAKWMADDDISGFVNLADAMYRMDVDANTATAKGVKRDERRRPFHSVSNGRLNREPEPEIPRWKVILWYLSMGYTPEQVAGQLHCGLETVKHHLRKARTSLGLEQVSTTNVVAEAIRKGVIP
jgi:DNA-binding CsgD family transcriptional regulator